MTVLLFLSTVIDDIAPLLIGMDVGDTSNMASRKLNKADTGIAGQSALVEYQKKSSKKKAKRIQMLGARLGKIANTILGDGHQAEAWEKGAIGEQAVGALLDKFSLELSFKVLQDRAIPGSRANIDHILISDRGIFVFDSKNYRGMVRINSEGGILTSLVETLYVGDRKQTALVTGVKKQVALVQKALDEGKLVVPVKGLLAFYNAEWPLLFRPQEIDGVLLNSKGVQAAVLDQPVIDGLNIEEVSKYLQKFFSAK